MSIPGVDYAFTTVDERALYAAGMRFAMRYVGPGTDGKHLHADERDRIWAAGLSIVLLVEGAADSALGGFTIGATHAQQAETARKALGAPALPMYFAVDFNATVAQWPACRAYLQGAASVIGLPRVGLYAGIRPIQWAIRDSAASWYFQTYAWSGGVWAAANHVEQYKNGVAMAGGVVDLCRAVRPAYGQWGPPGGVPDLPTIGDDMIIVRVAENGGYYQYPQPKWLKSEAAVNAALAAYGQTRANIVALATLDEVRAALGFVPDIDVPTDSFGNVLPAAAADCNCECDCGSELVPHDHEFTVPAVEAHDGTTGPAQPTA